MTFHLRSAVTVTVSGFAFAGLLLLTGACGDSDSPLPALDDDASASATPGTGSDASGSRETGTGPAQDGGSTASDASTDAPKVDAADAQVTRPRKYLCINGAGVDGKGGRTTGGNPWLEQFCATLGTDLIKDCSGSPCYSTFGFETVGNPSRTSLVGALDTNNDGRVTSADKFYDLVLIGYSWGGTNVRDMAEWMQTAAAFDPSRRQVAMMVTLDPYRPGAAMDVPANVSRFIEFRHSVAPASDCSYIEVAGVVVSGPYLGIVPRCKSTSQCTDYDYTRGGNTFYPGAYTPGRGYTGVKVDHCGLVNAAASALPALLAGRAYSPLPPTVPVATY
jgi:hypothetical protein